MNKEDIQYMFDELEESAICGWEWIDLDNGTYHIDKPESGRIANILDLLDRLKELLTTVH